MTTALTSRPAGTLTKWGNGQGLLIPKALCEALGWSVGQKLEFDMGEDTLTIRATEPVYRRTKRLTIAELFEGYTGECEPPGDWPTVGAEFDWGEPVGKEAW